MPLSTQTLELLKILTMSDSVNGGLMVKVNATATVVGSVEVANDSGNPIPVSQATHDNLNANANIQVGNTDVADANPVPTYGVNGVFGNGAITAIGAAAQILAANTNRIFCIIQNRGSADVFIGTTGVTTSTGVLLGPNGTLIMDNTRNAIFAIASTGTQNVFAAENVR